MIAALGRWWRRRQRRADMEFLLPIVCRTDLTTAYMALRRHMDVDPAWHRDFTRDELHQLAMDLADGRETALTERV